MDELWVKLGNALLDTGLLVTVLFVGFGASMWLNFMLLKIVFKLLPQIKSAKETLKEGTDA